MMCLELFVEGKSRDDMISSLKRVVESLEKEFTQEHFDTRESLYPDSQGGATLFLNVKMADEDK